MRPTAYIPKPWLLFGVAASGSYFTKPIFAQDTNTDDSNDNETDAPEPAPAPTTEEPAPAPAPTDAEPEEPTTEAPPPAETTEEPEAPTTEEPPPEETTSEEEEPTSTEEEEEPSTTDEGATISETGEPQTTEEMTSAPVITGGATESSAGFTDLPTLTEGYGIPTYPAAAVPPTKNAPFMQHSRAPDGTVFIAVGAILGAFALGLLLWRLIVSLLLHRSVERAAMAQHDVNAKTGFPAPPAPFYKYTDQGSQPSFGASPAARGQRRTTRGPIPSATPSQSNLFFSPTAAGANAGGNRASQFLPSGFYAAGSSPAAPTHGHSISLTNLRPDSHGHPNASRHTLNPSPPDSPSWPQRRDISNSSLARPTSQRAPSAYLEDLLADDPGALPPPHMPPGNGPRHPGRR